MTVKFRFRTRFITAAAAISFDTHPNVLRLHVPPTQRLVKKAIQLLPLYLRNWFETTFPEWNLPSRLVLKKYKEGWDEEFDTEIATYELVKPLQGIVVPKCYGELEYEGTRALLLSDVGGHNVATPEGSIAREPDFRRMLHTAFDALARFDVRHGDLKLDNLHVVGNKIMVLDLERVDLEPLSKEELAWDVNDMTDHIAERYRWNQSYLWGRGQLIVA